MAAQRRRIGLGKNNSVAGELICPWFARCMVGATQMRIPKWPDSKQLVSIERMNSRPAKPLGRFTVVRGRAAKWGWVFRSPGAVSMKRSPGMEARYSMPDRIAGVEDVKLEFARQLYYDCLERHGADHQETRLLSEYLSGFEKSSQSQR
jgi:hypothetical protein